ncbi:MAG: M23 family metallopeptidase [Bacillota bacterium]
MDRLNTTPFETISGPPPLKQKREPVKKYTHPARPPHRRPRSYHRGDARRAGSPGMSMLIKLGICAAACALVLVFKWIDSPLTNSAVQSVSAAVTDEVDFDEMLGKLQFVELDGILSVFGAGRTMAEPIAASKSYLVDDGRKAVLEGKQGEDVIAADAGTVIAVGEDASLGTYVCVKQSGDMELYYYGFEEVFVEDGQPVKKLDTLGTLSEQGTLTISVLKQGRPQNPGDYFEIDGE